MQIGDSEMADLFYLSLRFKSEDLPIFKITIHGTTSNMLADTGATESSVRTTQEAFQMPQKTKTCVGVSGTPIN